MDNCDFDPAYSRAIAYEQLEVNRRLAALKAQVRPFDFADLNGKPEPESWGPCYPKTASAAVEKWRRIERVRELNEDEARAYAAAIGEWIRGLNNPAQKRWRVPESDLHYHKHHTAADWRAKISAAFAAQAAADRREWALGKSKSKSVGDCGLTIAQVYAAAMAAKRTREAA